jgi:hypothetical protein
VTTDAPIIRTFRGDQQAVVEAEADADAAQMLRDGYVVRSRIWSRARAGLLQRLLALGRVEADLMRGQVSLTVIYDRAASTPDDQPA